VCVCESESETEREREREREGGFRQLFNLSSLQIDSTFLPTS
jgi:hypothetical protein